MSGTVFQIGFTACGWRMATLVENHPRSIIGTFWLPATVKNYENLGSRWIDYVLENNQAQAILNDIEFLRDDPDLAQHMVIVLTGNIYNPGDYSFMAGITRFVESESLLKLLAKHHIAAQTEVSYPDFFGDYEFENQSYWLWEKLGLNDWDNYIRLRLVAYHGQEMLEQWWRRIAQSS